MNRLFQKQQEYIFSKNECLHEINLSKVDTSSEQKFHTSRGKNTNNFIKTGDDSNNAVESAFEFNFLLLGMKDVTLIKYL